MTRDVPEGDPWATTCARRAASAKLHADGALDEVPCLACGYPTLTERGGYHICVVCHWEDDDSTRDQPDRPSAVNHGLYAAAGRRSHRRDRRLRLAALGVDCPRVLHARGPRGPYRARRGVRAADGAPAGRLSSQGRARRALQSHVRHREREAMTQRLRERPLLETPATRQGKATPEPGIADKITAHILWRARGCQRPALPGASSVAVTTSSRRPEQTHEPVRAHHGICREHILYEDGAAGNECLAGQPCRWLLRHAGEEWVRVERPEPRSGEDVRPGRATSRRA